MKEQDFSLKNTSSIAGLLLVELLVAVTVLALMTTGLYLLKYRGGVKFSRGTGEQTTSLKKTNPTQEEQKSPTQPEKLNPTLAPLTPFPTIPELEIKNDDTQLNQTVEEFNQLVNELDRLNQVETDLNLPEVDFSLE